jgi:hypothetical protein
MANMTDDQQAAFTAALARSAAREAEVAATPKQRVRTMAQGLTLGTADEMEAMARSLTTGRPYAEVLDEIRGQIKSYQEAYPKSSMGYEIGGAAIPTIVSMAAAPFTGGASTVAVAPTLARMAGMGALEGGAYAFGTGEGGFAQRALRVPGGIAGGAIGGAVGGAATRAISGGVAALSDSARRLVGRRGSSIVENEIQRLVEQTGKTADEIADDIINGRILAENATIRQAVRSLKTSGGDPTRILTEGLAYRPTKTRAAAMDELRTYLSDAGAPSSLQAQRRSEDVARVAEGAAYKRFEGVPAPDDVVSALEDTLRRVPSASKEVEIALLAQTGEAPFYKILEDGGVEFTRRPTIVEAERVRRAVSNRATALYRESMGGAGEAVANVEKGLRGSLDAGSPSLASARAQAAAVRQQRDVFDAGQKALTGDVNERLMEFSRLTRPEDIEAYRAGLMAALEARSATGSRQSMVRNLFDPETKEGQILRTVFPQDQLDDVLYKLNTAAEAQATSSAVLGGSATDAGRMEATRRGAGMSVGDITGVLSGSPDAIIKLASSISGRFARDLTDAERGRVAQILISENADLVKNAIKDESQMAVLQSLIETLAARATQASRRSSTVGASAPSSEFSGEALRGLLAQ